MAMSVISGFFTVNLVSTVFGDANPGPCPEVKIMQNFDMTRFDGRWFEAKRYFTETENNGKCVKGDYTLQNSTSMEFRHSEINTKTGEELSFAGRLFEPDPNEPGKLKMKFREMPITVDYWILGTDYKTYAAIYSCEKVKSSHISYAWILTRAQHPAKFVVNRALKVFERNQVDTKKFIDTDQTHCNVRVA